MPVTDKGVPPSQTINVAHQIYQQYIQLLASLAMTRFRLRIEPITSPTTRLVHIQYSHTNIHTVVSQLFYFYHFSLYQHKCDGSPTYLYYYSIMPSFSKIVVTALLMNFCSKNNRNPFSHEQYYSLNFIIVRSIILQKAQQFYDLSFYK